MDENKPTIEAGKLSKILISTVVLLFLLVIGGGVAIAVMHKQTSDFRKSATFLMTNLDERVSSLEAPNKYVQEQVDKTKLQAVFLENGQVYFGNITHIDQSTITLEDIFYLREGTFNKDNTVTGNISLVKLGNEVHGPEDKMEIERKNVSFWENLKPDGQVSKAIAAYKTAH